MVLDVGWHEMDGWWGKGERGTVEGIVLAAVCGEVQAVGGGIAVGIAF
jgi:hypothetical protein